MTGLDENDVTRLRALDKAIWNRSKDRFNFTHSFPNYKRPIAAEELKYVLKLIRKHELPCVLGSGPYGNLSMAVYQHAPYVGVPLERLISLAAEHLGVSKRDWDKQFDAFAKYTHSDRNRELLKFYGARAPGPRNDYAY